MNNKSKLRQEYESVFGVVEGTLRLYDANGYEVYTEFSDGYCSKQEYDAKGNMTYYEGSVGGSCKFEYDTSNNVIYRFHSIDGVTLDNRPCSSKVFIEEQTGKKFKMTEVSDEQI